MAAGLAVALACGAPQFALADGGSGSGGGTTTTSGGGLAPLASVAVPQPIGGDIVNQAAAVRLGKALFWDIQLGGDGQIACATCHFHAGADNRVINTVNPGPNGIFEIVAGPGATFLGGNVNNDDRVGSQGIVGSIFQSINADPTVAADNCTPDQTAPFFANRRVTGRNTPPIVAAAFNRDNFWDGRANNTFNGNDPFGLTLNMLGAIGNPVRNGSLASQAVGPPNNPTEVSCAGRSFNGPGSLGAKLLARQPLQFQVVSPTDSSLGSLSASPNSGLTKSYTAMISDAFGPAVAANAQNTFSRIWGQAVQAYEATLIPSQTPMDRFLAGNRAAMTAQQQVGMGIFTGKGACTNCHAGAEMTDASVGFAAAHGLVNEDGGDQGFHNIGVRPTAEDAGRAGTGPNGIPFSVSRSAKDNGAFKTAALRNVKLTAPYFHNGGKATLGDVVDFYSRGGDFANPEKAKRIQPRNFSAGEKTALVDFLTNGLTDCRTEKEAAPFDHPALPLPNGTGRPAVGAAGTGACN